MQNNTPVYSGSSNTNTSFTRQEITPDSVYLILANKFDTELERKKFCERLIEVHNLNSTAKSQIKIGDSSVPQAELYPKFNNWVKLVFNGLTPSDTAKIALLFDVFEEYTNNMDSSFEKIKIKVMQKIFSTYGNSIVLKLLKDNLAKLLYSFDCKVFDHLKTMLSEKPDIENLTNNYTPTVYFDSKRIAIIDKLAKNLSGDVTKLALYSGIRDNLCYQNYEINLLNNLNKILKANNNNYRIIAQDIGAFLKNRVLERDIYDLLR